MKHFRIAALALSATLMQAAVTQQEIASALDLARSTWRIDAGDVDIRMEPINPCPLGAGDFPRIAELQTLDSETRLITDDPDVAVVVTSHSRKFVILLNANCDWNKLNLRNTVIHEYGHILIGGDWHSKDPRSVMYAVVAGVQRVTDEDRTLAGKQAAK